MHEQSLGGTLLSIPLMSPPRIHVVGAGLAGLAAALRVGDAGAQVIVHEAAGQAGGRCRSYVDSALGIKIDNGNHLVLSGNHATLTYLARIGAADRLTGPAEAEFPFVDLAQKQRWLLKPNPGRVPWWIFAKTRRVPETRAADYLKIARLMWAGADATVEVALDPRSVLYRRLWRPLLLAALNTDPAEGSARLAVTISGADRLLDVEREELAEKIWREVAEIVGIAAPLPAWQIIKERRATFAATPEQNAKRPGAATRWHNLALAGDWTATGLPATIEGAIRSGNRAADVVLRGAAS